MAVQKVRWKERDSNGKDIRTADTKASTENPTASVPQKTELCPLRDRKFNSQTCEARENHVNKIGAAFAVVK